MNKDVIISCAVTGSGDTVGKHPAIPVTPEEIANAAIEAASAGAAIAHMHVRNPETGKATRDDELYKEVVSRIKENGTDVIINLTSGMGGDIEIGPEDDLLKFGPNTDFINAMERLSHVEKILPDICSLDCGTLNFGDGNMIYVSTPEQLRIGAKRIQELGVKPELEIFDTGHMWFANQMYNEGLLDAPALYQICLGIPYGAPANTSSMENMVKMVPEGSNWAAFGIGAMQMPMAAQAVLLGGNVRVGLEDNLYLEKGVFASNGSLVEKVGSLINHMGASIMSAKDARKKLGLKNA
ncbi:MAG: 3-keto-5-aminohexanoate cleavage protein [Candidatus Pelagibacterales bacterium]|jgi:uncharacterized protein (DUF849 family)|nr:3-keto-5-aminohexanoate cleavage protein [Pelagibacteraceae bacterium]|tara:strand:+ start:89 stop:976 length:888 start_codon:yes stop_codon:yes gene_type:complete